MDKIANFVGRPLQWDQASVFKAHYELRSGEILIATLQFRSMWRTLATAQSADGCWTLQRVGFWHTRTIVRACDSEEEIATFRNNTWSGGGTLALPDGREYPVHTNIWQTQYELKTPEGDSLIHYRNRGVLRASAEVTIFPNAKDLPELPWMVLLGWYTILITQKESVDAAAVPG